MMLSKSGAGSALTQVTEAADHVTITIPSGKGGVLKFVSLQVKCTRETVVNAGGLVKLRNSSADWEPFHLLTALDTAVTAGGSSDGKPMMYAVSKPLPGNSVVYANFLPYDNQSQFLCVTLGWELGAEIAEETFSGSIFPLKAAAVTAATRASPGSYAVPGMKGGRIYALAHQPWGTLETVVCGGGKVEVSADAYDMYPTEYYTTFTTAVGAAGGGNIKPDIIPWDAPLPENGNITTHYTPVDDQSQTLASLILWKTQREKIRRVKIV